MIFECAPMEGVTDYVFRQVQRRLFAPADRYYTPFISPTASHCLTPRQLRELRPENNEGISLVPQLIGHNAEDFLWAAGEIKAMGYDEVNFNLGCPSGTVVGKKKGSGLLSELEMLREFLDEVFEKTPVDISVKTRIGRESPREFAQILELYRRYPMKELIIHCRVQKQQYKGVPELSAWESAVNELSIPLCYNGDLFDRGCVNSFLSAYPQTERLMLGRGLAADPALIAELRGGDGLTKDKLEAFHAEVLRLSYEKVGHEGAVLLHMKELWQYLSCDFIEVEKPLKAVKKARCQGDYDAAVAALFRDCVLRETSGFIAR